LNFRKARQLGIQLNINVLDLALHDRWQPQVLTWCRSGLRAGLTPDCEGRAGIPRDMPGL
jgi:hypothetical protein